MLHVNGVFSLLRTYFGINQPVFMMVFNIGLIVIFYALTKKASKKHQVV